MKKITLLAIFLTLTAYSQEYKLVGYGMSGQMLKADGFIKIQDSLMIMRFSSGSVDKTADYDITHERNGVIYVTDGMVDYHLQIEKLPGETKFKKIVGLKYKKDKEPTEYQYQCYFYSLGTDPTLIPVYYLQDADN